MWVAPLVYLVVSVVLWQLANALFMPELLSNRLFEVLPASMIESGVQMLGAMAKPLAFYGIAVLYFGAYFIFSRSWNRLRSIFGNAFYAGFALWGLHVLVIILAAGQGLFAFR